MIVGVYLDEMLGPGVAAAMSTRAATTGLRLERAALALPGGSDAEQLAFASARRLALITRNLHDFRQLHQLWHVMRRWGVLPGPHGGILAPAGIIERSPWGDVVMDLVLHPRCPSLDEQLLIWVVAERQWVSDHPFSHRRRQPVRL